MIEHKPGSRIQHVDELSRHVGAIKHPNSLDKENVLQEQKTDSFVVRKIQEPTQVGASSF